MRGTGGRGSLGRIGEGGGPLTESAIIPLTWIVVSLGVVSLLRWNRSDTGTKGDCAGCLFCRAEGGFSGRMDEDRAKVASPRKGGAAAAAVSMISGLTRSSNSHKSREEVFSEPHVEDCSAKLIADEEGGTISERCDGGLRMLSISSKVRAGVLAAAVGLIRTGCSSALSTIAWLWGGRDHFRSAGVEEDMAAYASSPRRARLPDPAARAEKENVLSWRGRSREAVPPNAAWFRIGLSGCRGVSISGSLERTLEARGRNPPTGMRLAWDVLIDCSPARLYVRPLIRLVRGPVMGCDLGRPSGLFN